MFFLQLQELIDKSFMCVDKLRFERITTTILASTVQQPCPFPATAGVMSSKTGPVAVRSNIVTTAALLSSACDLRIRCPAYPLNSEASAIASCVEEITPYYLVSKTVILLYFYLERYSWASHSWYLMQGFSIKPECWMVTPLMKAYPSVARSGQSYQPGLAPVPHTPPPSNLLYHLILRLVTCV